MPWEAITHLRPSLRVSIKPLTDFSDIEVQLYGDEAKIKQYLTATERVSIIHTDEKIDSDDEPTKAIRKKKNASMVWQLRLSRMGMQMPFSLLEYRCSFSGRIFHRRSYQEYRPSWTYVNLTDY